MLKKIIFGAIAAPIALSALAQSNAGAPAPIRPEAESGMPQSETPKTATPRKHGTTGRHHRGHGHKHGHKKATPSS